jgi:hypothetical protein
VHLGRILVLGVHRQRSLGALAIEFVSAEVSGLGTPAENLEIWTRLLSLVWLR